MPRPSAPAHVVIDEYWLEHQDEFPDNPRLRGGIFKDCCMSCGIVGLDVTDMERCHLEDYAYRQRMDVPNFVLLCGLCHRMMPSFTSRDDALDWVRALARLHMDPVLVRVTMNDGSVFVVGPLPASEGAAWVQAGLTDVRAICEEKLDVLLRPTIVPKLLNRAVVQADAILSGLLQVRAS